MKFGPSGAVILAYHNVVEDGTPMTPGVDELTVTESQLRCHLRIMKTLRLRITDVSHIASLVAAGEDPSGLAAITFDDALAGLARVGLDVLNQEGVSATIYVPTDHPGESPAFWPGAERTMTTEELQAAVADGHTLGSHTASHQSLVSLEPLQLADQLRRSKLVLERLADRPIESLAYPSGHHNATVRAAAAEAGFTSAATFLNGRATSDVDHYRLPRLTMGAHSSAPRFAYHLLRPARSWPDHQLSTVGESAAE